MNNPYDPQGPQWNQGNQGNPYGGPGPQQSGPPPRDQPPAGDPFGETQARPIPPGNPYGPPAGGNQYGPPPQPGNQYGNGPYGNNPYGAPGYSDPAAAYGAPQASEKTNGLAIAALIAAFIVAPIGIVLGHFSLSEIKRNREGGGPIAVSALVVGYLFTAVAIVGLVLWLIPGSPFNSDDDDSNEASGPGSSQTTDPSKPSTPESDATYSYPSSYSYPSYSTPSYSYPSSTYSYPRSTSTGVGETTPPGYSPDPSDPIANTIRTTDTGACVNRQAEGSRLTSFSRVPCTSGATDRVYLRTTSTSSCGEDWVQAPASSYYSQTVVLCLTPLNR
ncbi:DUF4190 domain-containing protein [Gordonia sp. ABSL1-1]|uniref:DUF4190 domain-containing protein n=1 Tax=Gordonia sp. ABSL1-1 TaxID=3053923 RepID=UPI0025732E05|nr:DUF4190 domain-containing protein [Gordonia sp. ABSL1-1]MDL9936368.1 DUF4190 domain-containing protein [Gordonia sp. ABSL1-1]